MAKIIIKFVNDVVDHIDLKQGDMKIGRKPGCEIHIDNLSVSGEHANIFTVGEDSFIQDLGSTNGTFINNKKITKHHLKNGDTVVIGKHSLIYLSDSVRTSQPPEDFARTVIINPSRTVEPKPAAPASTEAAAITLETKPKDPPPVVTERRRVGAIFVLSGMNSGKRIDLSKKVTNLGSAGKRAGSITHTAGGFTLAPGADENPKLNGRPIPTEGARLKNGDVIEVAGTRLQFYLK